MKPVDSLSLFDKLYKQLLTLKLSKSHQIQQIREITRDYLSLKNYCSRTQPCKSYKKLQVQNNLLRKLQTFIKQTLEGKDRFVKSISPKRLRKSTSNSDQKISAQIQQEMYVNHRALLDLNKILQCKLKQLENQLLQTKKKYKLNKNRVNQLSNMVFQLQNNKSVSERDIQKKETKIGMEMQKLKQQLDQKQILIKELKNNMNVLDSQLQYSKRCLNSSTQNLTRNIQQLNNNKNNLQKKLEQNKITINRLTQQNQQLRSSQKKHNQILQLENYKLATQLQGHKSSRQSQIRRLNQVIIKYQDSIKKYEQQIINSYKVQQLNQRYLNDLIKINQSYTLCKQQLRKSQHQNKEFQCKLIDKIQQLSQLSLQNSKLRSHNQLLLCKNQISSNSLSCHQKQNKKNNSRQIFDQIRKMIQNHRKL